MKRIRGAVLLLRRPLRASLHALDRLPGVDLLLFAAALLWKLYVFNKLISVLYMDMNLTDAIIETGAILLLSFWTLLLPVRGRIVALIALNAGVSALLYADTLYYRYFQDLISVPVLQQLGQVGALTGSIRALQSADDWKLFADMPLLLVYAVYVIGWGRKDLTAAGSMQPNRLGKLGGLAKLGGLSKHGKLGGLARLGGLSKHGELGGLAKPGGLSKHGELGELGGLGSSSPRKRRFWFRCGMSAAVFALGCGLFFVNLNKATDTWAKGLFERNFWNVSIYNVAGGLGYHGYDLYRYAKLNWFGAVQVSAGMRSEAEAWIEERGASRAALERDELFGAYRGSNVLTVQVEALQSFVLGQSIGGQEITPVLNRLLEESAYFDRFYHQTAQGRTSDADFAANCSLHPLKSGSVFIQYGSKPFRCLPTELKDNGYAASVFHAYQGGFWNRNVMYRSMNYDHFFSLKHYRIDEPMGWSLGDKSFYRQSMDVVADMPQPFYAFMISLTSHHPYKMPANENKLDLEELDGTMLGDYLQSIHYADAALGELIERLKAERLWEQTIFVVYGDHDNSIAEWDHYARFTDKAGREPERDEMTRDVPLIIHLPDGALSGTHSAVGGQADIAPTIMHLLGISSGDLPMIGAPLLVAQPAPESKPVVFRDGSWTDGKLKYTASPDGIHSNGKCYSADTGEPVEVQLCEPGSAEAERELAVSDLLVTNESFRLNGRRPATEAMAPAQ